MDFSAPWIPSANGNALPMFERLRQVLENDAKPSPRTDKAWLPSSLSGTIAKAPEAKGAILDCVLSLWRLKEAAPSEGEEEEDEVWRDHVSAWLVSVGYRLMVVGFANIGVRSFVTAISAGTSTLNRSR